MTTLTYETRLHAARILLARWYISHIQTVRLDSGAAGGPRLWPEALRPEHVHGAVWPIQWPGVAAMLVATVATGTRYAGWSRALRQAERDIAAERAGGTR